MSPRDIAPIDFTVTDSENAGCWQSETTYSLIDGNYLGYADLSARHFLWELKNKLLPLCPDNQLFSNITKSMTQIAYDFCVL